MLFLYAVLATGIVMALGLWALATNGHVLDYPAGKENLWKHTKWWHVPIIFVVVLLPSWGISAGVASAGKADAESGYRQFLNGALVSANVNDTRCTKDGSCVHTYQCDSYTVFVTHYHTDSKGNTYTTEDPETRYHDCPETTDEFTYTATATFGFKNVTYGIPNGDHIFSAHPIAWRSGESGEIEHGVPEGAPAVWLNYKKHIAAGNADPVTAPDTYTNYILASQDSLLKAYSDQVTEYLKRGLLPEHTAGMLKRDPIHDLIDADKMSFVGFTPPDKRMWEDRLMRFNAALGMELQGDMHIVAVDNKRIGAGQSEGYFNALKAYWQGPMFGKKALAKNGIIIAIGVDQSSNKIDWARAGTGMPVGNGEMISAINLRLPGTAFTPQALLGKVRAVPVQKNKQPSIKYELGDGMLTKIIFHDFPFARACMQCKNKGDNGTSYTYLEADILLPAWAYVLDIVLAVLAGLLGLGVVYMTSPAWDANSMNPRPLRNGYRY